MMPPDPEEHSASMRAEAAAWLARLRSGEVREQDLAGFRRWLAEDMRHRSLFEQVTDSWEFAGGAVAQDWQRTRSIGRRAMLLGGGSAALGAAAIGAGVIAWPRDEAETFDTAKGEQRRIALADGSIVTLDTETRIAVSLGRRERLVEIAGGRAHFQVAHDAARPFAVRAGERQVVALGTAFDVSRFGSETAVLLVEGRVAVREAGSGSTALSRPLVPGERMIFRGAGLIIQDKPDLARLTAWQSGRLAFDGEPLSRVVAEMNRYNRRPLRIADDALGNARISGIYEVGDAEGFARSVSDLLSTSFEVQPDAIVLSLGRPQAKTSG